MTKKSAASAKVKKPEMTTDEKMDQLHNLFDAKKWEFEETIKTQVIIANRADNYFNIRDLALRFFKEEEVTPSLTNEMTDESVHCYELVLECAKEFTFEEFIKDEAPAYFIDIMPDRKRFEDKMDEVYGAIRYMSVKPYGDKMLQMWQELRLKKIELGL